MLRTHGDIRHLKHQTPTGNISASPTADKLCIASRNCIGIYALNDEISRAPQCTLRHGMLACDTLQSDVCVHWHPTNENTVASTMHSRVALWDVQTESRVSAISAHSRVLMDLHWSPFLHSTLATCSLDACVKLWDTREQVRNSYMTFGGWQGTCNLDKHTDTHTAGATQVQWHRKRPHVLASAHKDCINIWDMRNGSVPVKQFKAACGRISGLDWSHHRDELVGYGYGNNFSVWRTDLDSEGTLIQLPGQPVKVRYTPCGDSVLVIMNDHNFNLKLVALQDPEKNFSMQMNDGANVKDFEWIRDCNDTYVLLTWGLESIVRKWTLDDDVRSQLPEVAGDFAINSEDSFTVFPPYLTAKILPESSFKKQFPLGADTSKCLSTLSAFQEELVHAREAFPGFVYWNGKSEMGNHCLNVSLPLGDINGRRVLIPIQVRYTDSYPNSVTTFSSLQAPDDTNVDMSRLSASLKELNDMISNPALSGKAILVHALRFLHLSIREISVTKSQPSGGLLSGEKTRLNRADSTATTHTTSDINPDFEYEVEVYRTRNIDERIPFPRLCGATFTPLGKLVVFFPMKGGKSETTDGEREPGMLFPIVPKSIDHFYATHSTTQANCSNSSGYGAHASKSLEDMIQGEQSDSVDEEERFSFGDAILEPSSYKSLDSIISRLSEADPLNDPNREPRIVTLVDMTEYWPVKPELSRSYSYFHPNVVKSCQINYELAKPYATSNVQTTWNLISHTLCDKLIKPVGTKYFHDWSSHPLGRLMMSSLIRYHASMGDIQTCAVISALLSQLVGPESSQNKSAAVPRRSSLDSKSLTRTPRSQTTSEKSVKVQSSRILSWKSPPFMGIFTAQHSIPENSETVSNALDTSVSRKASLTNTLPSIKRRMRVSGCNMAGTTTDFAKLRSKLSAVSEKLAAQTNKYPPRFAEWGWDTDYVGDYPLLDQNDCKLHLTSRRMYGQVLVQSGLLVKSLELQKGTVKEKEPSLLELLQVCQKCGYKLKTGDDRCKRCRKPTRRCSVCHGKAEKESTFCLSCGHGGHSKHLSSWFKSNNECPTGCGCRCTEVN